MNALSESALSSHHRTVRSILARRLVATALLPFAALLAGTGHATVSSPSGAQGTATIHCRAEGDGYFVDSSGVGFDKARMLSVSGGQDASAGSWSDWEDLPYFTKGFYRSTEGGDTVYVEYGYWNGQAWEIVGEQATVADAKGIVGGDHC